MRIVIHLHACRFAPPAAGMDATLALVQEIVRLARAGGHDIHIALDFSDMRQLETLRQSLAGLLPPSLVHASILPAGADARVTALVREGAIAALAPDLAFIPDFDRASAAPCTIGAPSAGFHTVVGLNEAGGANAATLERAARAALILGPAGLPDSGDARMQALGDDPVRAAAQAWALFTRLGPVQTPVGQAPARRLRLACVSPLPPEQSGIADYSAQLMRVLARYYEIDAIVDQPLVEPLPDEGITVHDCAWFDAHAHEYDRVLYHFGNSQFHKHMFGLLERHPGVVVLHDFYLGNVLEYLEHTGYTQVSFMRALFESHGYPALIDMQKTGRSAAAWKYPSNKPVLEQARGVIVHSQQSRELATRWYGADLCSAWQVIPLLRDGAPLPGRDAARAQLGLAPGQFVLVSFGMLGPAKLNSRLLEAWLASPLAADPDCALVFVGAGGGTPYSDALLATIAASEHGARIRVTGYVSAAEYQLWLAAADGAVQLRANTRGETSAAILDCMGAGLATIVNAHGSAVELPADALIRVDDTFSTEVLMAALVLLHDDPQQRAALGQRAAQHVRTYHSAEPVGRRYVDAIEGFVALHSEQPYHALIDAVAAAAEGAPVARALTLAHAANAIAANQADPTQRRLFVDISAVVRTDIKTGIQRVVRSTVQNLLTAPPPELRIEPVCTRGDDQIYRYARHGTAEMIGVGGPLLSENAFDDAPIDAREGDIFLGLDLLIYDTWRNEQVLLDMRARGVRIYFVVFDMLPLLRPEMFPENTMETLDNWLRTISMVSDGLICISRAVADEVCQWLLRTPPRRSTPLKIGYFHLGADIAASLPTYGMPEQAARVLASVNARPTLLSVGTVEPRKGHLQSLEACELLWARGVDINYVIVGKCGWMVDVLAARLKSHAELGSRLFWLEGISDEMLQTLYESSSVLLAASEGEGFGLPLIEAAQHDLPIIARNLPVFREVLGEHGFYFSGLDDASLADAIEAWLALDQAGQAPQSDQMRWLTWAESVGQLLDVVEGNDWYRTVPGDGR